MLIVTRPGRVVTYNEELLLRQLDDSSITISLVRFHDKSYTLKLSYSLDKWSPNM